METESIVWSPVSQEACSMKDLSYFITIIPLSLNYRTFSTEVNNISFPSKSNTSYIVLVGTQIKADQLQSETVSAIMFTTGKGDIITSSKPCMQLTIIYIISNLATTSTTSNLLQSGATFHTNTMPVTSCTCDDIGINSSSKLVLIFIDD